MVMEKNKDTNKKPDKPAMAMEVTAQGVDKKGLSRRKDKPSQLEEVSAKDRTFSIDEDVFGAGHDGSSLFDRHQNRRPRVSRDDANCLMRAYIRNYCGIIGLLCYFSVYYTKIFCLSDWHSLFDNTAYMPAVFEKYDTSFTCPSFARTRRSMVYSVLVFYSLRYFNKVLLSLFYAIMLIVFALEIHDNQLIWLKTKKYVTAAEYSTQFSEKVMVTLHNLLLVPLMYGFYFLIRHVRRSHSKIELEAINELQMERSNRLKELMKLEDEFACKAEYAAAQYKNHIEIRKIMEKNRLTDRRGKWLEIKRTPIVRREKYELYKQSQAVMALLKQLEAKKKDKEKLRNANREMRRNREKAAVEKTVARVTKSKSKKKETKEQNSEVAVEIDVTKVVKKDVTTKRKATVKPPDRSKTSKNKTLKTKKSARRGILKKPAKKESRKGL